MIMHHHIQKTGGTAINFAFFRLAGDPEAIYRKVNQRPALNARAGGMLYTRAPQSAWTERPFYAFSHQPAYSIDLPQEAFRFCVFRDPVERVVSQYRSLLMRRDQGLPREGHRYLGDNYRDFLRLVPRKWVRAQLSMWTGDEDPDRAWACLLARADHWWIHADMAEGFARLRQKLLRRFPARARLLRGLHLTRENETVCAWQPSASDLEATRQAVGPGMEFWRLLLAEVSRCA